MEALGYQPDLSDPRSHRVAFDMKNPLTSVIRHTRIHKLRVLCGGGEGGEPTIERCVAFDGWKGRGDEVGPCLMMMEVSVKNRNRDGGYSEAGLEPGKGL
ncbi:hypothetical protein FNV43_RR00722 [Rhamnella rubrinervis]|uniref:Uncharacterized protein n=1 Tax=Rhamnella rubrinervis TaxID=2594499 RepID=A0A8K0MS79_9ROSA|nr:hypothetical protein FNV43_RR00722 [Rhamnella rubrinervis]